MAEMTADALIARVQKGEAFERSDLRGLALKGASLPSAKLRRAALDGADMQSARLQKAELVTATLREAFLAGADLSGANLEGADLESANLKGAILRGANLTRASLEGADLSDADLTDANLNHAQLHGARLGGANLTNASCSHADMRGCDLSKVQLCGVDLSHVDLAGADLMGADLTGAKVVALMAEPSALEKARAKWVDISPNGQSRASTLDAWLASVQPQKAQRANKERYFGAGDVLRNASLRFGAHARVEIESVFEDCDIELGNGTELIIGEEGILAGCQIHGSGRIVVCGSFFEGQKPGIRGAQSLEVRASGTLVSTIEQREDPTQFAFAHGCRMRLRILQAKA